MCKTRFIMSLCTLSLGCNCIKEILQLDLLTFSKNLTKTIVLFNDNIALSQINQNVFTDVFISQSVNSYFTILISKQTDHAT